jgi:RNA polymerase sigma-70 factor (ECF subfamily)
VLAQNSAARRQNHAPARRARRTAAPDRALQDLWVTRLRAGDQDTLREVIAAFGERITAVVSGILRDRDAVDDVVQETFAKAWFRISSFKGDSGLYTWLYRVAVNASKDYIKGRKRRPASSLDEVQTGHLPAAEPHVLEGLERREARLAVRAAIAALPEHYRSVLALRELEGMTYDQIAEVLGLSLGTVESRLFRARKRFRALVLKEEARRGLRTIRGSKGRRT